jgi:CheY-like chemotaxis protein
MIVDDERDFLYTLGYWLKSKGYNVTTFFDSREAVDSIKKVPPDVIFLDINMPVMDGLQTLKTIRTFNKDIPVIMITAYADDKKVAEIEKHGIAGFFYKDKDFSEGIAMLETVLRLHKSLKKQE